MFYLGILANESDIFFQQNNALPHVSSKTRTWFTQKKIKLFPLPAQSPDLSPIENIWDVIQRQINERIHLPSNLEGLKLIVLVGKGPKANSQNFDHGHATEVIRGREVKRLPNKVLKVEITRLPRTTNKNKSNIRYHPFTD